MRTCPIVRRLAVYLPLLAASAGGADPTFSLPDMTLPEGAAGEKMFVHCSHPDVAALAFSVSLRYDPAALQVTEVTTAGTSVEGLDYWEGSHDPATGEIIYGGILDNKPPLQGFLPPAADHTLACLVVAPVGAAPAVTDVRFVDGLGSSYPIKNILTDDQGRTIHPAFHDGSVRVVSSRCRAAEGFTPGSIDGGSRAVLFAADLGWEGAEAGRCLGMRFRAAGSGDESALLGAARIYHDSNGDGRYDASDGMIGGPVEVAIDDGPLSFDLDQAIAGGVPARVFLVAELSPATVRAGVAGAPGALLAGLLLVSLAGKRLRRGRRRWLALILAGTFLAVFPVACGGGGGGGGGSNVTPLSGEVRFDLEAVRILGASTGVEPAMGGLPLPGPIFAIGG